jgi:predicted glycosyltransferase
MEKNIKVLIDINHPAQVHLFKNFIKRFTEKGNIILITAKEKECVSSLLRNLNFSYVLTGRGHRNLFMKILGFIGSLSKIIKAAKDFKPDIFLSDGSISAALAAALLGRPHIALEDTGNLEQVFLYLPFTDVILSPDCIKINLGRKHVKIKGYYGIAYLHQKYFVPDKNILAMLGTNEGERFVIVRFSGHAATHDFGARGITSYNKIRCVEEFSKHAKVFISSEGNLPPNLKKFKLNISPEKIHDAVYYASLVYSEGATMASEASILGTPAIYVDHKGRDYTRDQQQRYDSIFNFTDSAEDREKSIHKGVELLNDPDIKQIWEAKRKKILEEHIDLTSFLIWFLEDYPKSFDIIKQNPDYQLRFK